MDRGEGYGREQITATQRGFIAMKDRRQTSAGRSHDVTGLQLGENAVVDAGVILGCTPPSDDDCPPVLIIGPDAHIRHGTVIYAGSCIGKGLETGHNVIIRERNIIGDNLRIWGNSTVDYCCRIGSNVKIHHGVYVTQYTTIEDDAFLGPGVTLANDIHPGCPDSLRCMKGPTIRRGAQVGINSCVLPRVVIGEYALVGAGSVVTRDIPPGGVAYGNPARVVGDIEEMVCTTGLRDSPYEHLMTRRQHAHIIR